MVRYSAVFGDTLIRILKKAGKNIEHVLSQDRLLDTLHHFV